MGQPVPEMNGPVPGAPQPGQGVPHYAPGVPQPGATPGTVKEGKKFGNNGNRVCWKIENFKRPVIAAINGF